jgi:hypothetical protein
MSSLTCNGVTISLNRTISFNGEVVYDESGVDAKWTRVRLEVEGVITPQGSMSYNAETGAQEAGHAPVESYQVLKQRLMVPQQTLHYQSYGETIIESPADGMDTDPAGTGPRPISANFGSFGEAQCCQVTHVIDINI